MKKFYGWGGLLLLAMVVGGVILSATNQRDPINVLPDYSHLFRVEEGTHQLELHTGSWFDLKSDAKIHYHGDKIITVVNHSKVGYGYQLFNEDLYRIEGDTLIIGVDNDLQKYYDSIANPNLQGKTLEMSSRFPELSNDAEISFREVHNHALPLPESLKAELRLYYLQNFETKIRDKWKPNSVMKPINIGPTHEPVVIRSGKILGLTNEELDILSPEEVEAIMGVRYLRYNFIFIDDPELLEKLDVNFNIIRGADQYFDLLRSYGKFVSITMPIEVINTTPPEDVWRRNLITGLYRSHMFKSFNEINKRSRELMDHYTQILKEYPEDSDEYRLAARKQKRWFAMESHLRGLRSELDAMYLEEFGNES